MYKVIEEDIMNIENMIYEIDRKKVMLDSALAKLYHVETKRINEAVKNNPNSFLLDLVGYYLLKKQQIFQGRNFRP